MSQTAETSSKTCSIIAKCVEWAQANGLRGIQTDRRLASRLPFVHPVRYYVGRHADEQNTDPGYVLDISLAGMCLWCRESLAVDKCVHVRLPLADGSYTWLQSRVVFCEPDDEHYRAGLAFTEHFGEEACS